ncbi:transcription factor bHLH19-like [Chenopodium quinoa]|uniref:transcription factor bHLH19-like n=1 Tax=Chenopodium quinoa TaxID=63459 RepID=UPI000B793E44|nr:transcription factor bHLH19-like [Chenopodium quinoa]XP_021747517.1 transcription factor bHLH19-like [Chenopodium quinoa]
MEACRFVIRSKEQNDEDDTATSGDVSNTANLDIILPEILLKVFDEKILLNVFCEKRKGILTTILKEVEKYDLRVVNCSTIPFDNKAMDITIVAQMERGFNHKMKDLIKTLRSALLVASP